MSDIHAILFKKNKYDVKKARDFLKRHKYKPKYRVQKSNEYLRYTLTPATENGIYRTISFNNNIKAVIEFQKGGKATTQIQAIIFEKEKFTSSKARDWLKKHNYTPIKRVDKTKNGNYLRYRLLEPKKNVIYRTINFGDDIKAIIEILDHSKRVDKT